MPMYETVKHVHQKEAFRSVTLTPLRGTDHDETTRLEFGTEKILVWIYGVGRINAMGQKNGRLWLP